MQHDLLYNNKRIYVYISPMIITIILVWVCSFRMDEKTIIITEYIINNSNYEKREEIKNIYSN